MAILELIKLECKRTEDSSGPDEAYIEFNDKKVWGTESINDGHSKSLTGVDMIPFFGSARIELYDKDRGKDSWVDSDDKLGTITINAANSSTTELTGKFTSDGADYTLTYRVLPIGHNYTFDANITDAQQKKLLEQHRRAFAQAGACKSIAKQKPDVLEVFSRAIHHDIETNPNANGSAFLNGSTVSINFTVLFPKGDDEIAQTLIHEMMHCAGHSHPTRTASDVAGDGGVYFGTVPLQAELCVAGKQSDAICVKKDKSFTLTGK